MTTYFFILLKIKQMYKVLLNLFCRLKKHSENTTFNVKIRLSCMYPIPGLFCSACAHITFVLFTFANEQRTQNAFYRVSMLKSNSNENHPKIKAYFVREKPVSLQTSMRFIK